MCTCLIFGTDLFESLRTRSYSEAGENPSSMLLNSSFNSRSKSSGDPGLLLPAAFLLVKSLLGIGALSTDQLEFSPRLPRGFKAFTNSVIVAIKQ